MGYTSRFLVTHDSELELAGVQTEYGGEVEYDGWTDHFKWYGHHEDMCAHSLKYPDVVFTISGEGEENGDVWISHYKGGVVIEEKQGYNIFGFERITRKKLEDEIVRQVTGVFSPDDVVFILGGVKRAFDKLGVE